MSIPAHKRRYTLVDYLEVEELSPAVKHELVDGEIFAMAGGTVEHAALSTSISALLVARLRGGPYHVYSSDLRIRIREANIATYADATVVCGAVERDPESTTHVTNPRVVIEVLSKSTESYDRDEKRLYYQLLPSLREYVLVAQDRRRIEVWRRDGDAWTHSIHEAGDTVPMPSVGVELDVDEVYELAGVRAP